MLSKATFCLLRSPPHTLSKTSVVFLSRFKTEVHINCIRFFFREKSDSQILRFLISLVRGCYFANINNIRINRNCVILFFKMVGTTKWVVVVLALLIVVTKGKMSFEFYLYSWKITETLLWKPSEHFIWDIFQQVVWILHLQMNIIYFCKR